MEIDLDDANFWLPSEFLNEDGNLKTGKPATGNKGMSILKGFGSYGLDSDLSSPVESVMGSTETESDEEDYLNEFTRKLANSALDDGDEEDNFSKPENKPTRVLAGSPQSTLCDYKEVSVNGISDCRLQLPPVTSNRNQIAPQPPRRIPNPNPNPQFHQIQLKQQQMMKQRQQQYEEMVTNGGGGPLPGWPALQQKPPGMGMRAVFLGNPNKKRESAGTGVFLPRQIIETRNKKGCSTVLLPEKVIQALNLNVGRFPHHYDVGMRNRDNVMMVEPRRQQDLRLPQEWTY